MSAESLFQIVNFVALAGWGLLVFLPKWRGTRWIVVSALLPLLLAVAYLTLLFLYIGNADGGFGSLAEVSKLFRNDHLLLAGWIHYLAFDLFVGAWELSNAQKSGVPHPALVPCLALTFLFGPVGLLLYSIVRAVYTQRFIFFIDHDNR